MNAQVMTLVLTLLGTPVMPSTPMTTGPETYPPPGTLVDVGGRRIHLHCTGAGSPTVILEAGASAYSIDWALVQPAVARTNRVCSYDRAGSAWSDPVPVAHEGELVVRDLHAALQAAGERPPYVLVGASLGSLFVRLYQHRHPADVAGLVLVDGTHEDGLFLSVDGEVMPVWAMSAAQVRATIAVPPATPGPVADPTLEPFARRLPPDLQRVRLWLQRRAAEAQRAPTFEAVAAFMEGQRATLATLHAIDSARPHPLDDLPLRVLTRGVNLNDRVKTLQANLARLSSKGTQTIVEGADHEIHLFQPDAVIRAITDVIAASRSATRAHAPRR